jgi:hypothetical protein
VPPSLHGRRLAVNPEQQRIAIAEACGWTKIRLHPRWVSDIGSEFPPTLCGTHPSKGRPEGIPWWGPLPDYLNDLNAMHEAERRLEAEDNHAYGCYCSELYEKYGNTVSLTAAQRAKAFCEILNLSKP